MKKSSLIFIFILTGVLSFAQEQYQAEKGYIKFFSHTDIEDITADNNEVAGILNSETGEVSIKVIMTLFDFKKDLMEKHFNKNYVESEEYPEASFKGIIVNNGSVDYSKPAVYKVMVKGEMTIHGKTNIIETGGTIDVNGKGIVARTKFLLNPADYDIEIPKMIKKRISEQLEITVEMNYMPIY